MQVRAAAWWAGAALHTAEPATPWPIPAAPPRRGRAQPALNSAAIRAWAAGLGMLETTLNELTALTPGTLGPRPGQRADSPCSDAQAPKLGLRKLASSCWIAPVWPSRR
jgi:hypothetical protein